MIALCIEIPGAPEGLPERLDAVCALCCREEGIGEAVAVGRLVTDEEIRRINRAFRGIDRATDVLSFPSIPYRPGRTARCTEKRLRRERDPETGLPHLGDFAIALPTAVRQAAEYGHSLERELCYLTAHALFHLMGHDHEKDEDRAAMRAMEERVMDQMNLRRASEMTDRALFERACRALENAYAPYSHFSVGACVLADDGRAFDGVNIENASYGATICAERAAVCAAVSQGARRITAVAVAGQAAPAWPCGICRQVLYEFGGSDLRILCGAAGTGEYETVPLSALLPHPFGPNDL